MDNLVKMLRPWVTTFSEEIKYRYAHKDELCVGGKIERIFDYASIVEKEDQMTFITLDDGIGLLRILIPGKIYNLLKVKYKIKEGMLVLANGRLFDPKGILKNNLKNKFDEEIAATLLCWNIEPFSEKLETNK